MNEKIMAGIAVTLYSFCWIALWIPAFVLAGQWANEGIDNQVYSFSYVNQIPRDWRTRPYSDLIITDQTVCPDSHPELAFSRPWYGTDLGCDCTGIRQEDTNFRLLDNANRVLRGQFCDGNQTAAGCRHGIPQHPV